MRRIGRFVMDLDLLSGGVARLHCLRETVSPNEGVIDAGAVMDVASGFERILNLDSIRSADGVNELRSNDLAAREWPSCKQSASGTDRYPSLQNRRIRGWLRPRMPRPDQRIASMATGDLH